MPFFTDVALSAPLIEGGSWITLLPLGFRSTTFTYPDGMPKYYIVPRGYASDLATVPRIPGVFWWVGGHGQAAALLHDFLYENGKRLRMITNRLEADVAYYEALSAMQVSQPLAITMFAAVRAFGRPRYAN